MSEANLPVILESMVDLIRPVAHVHDSEASLKFKAGVPIEITLRLVIELKPHQPGDCVPMEGAGGFR